ncbi:hypothetical protein EDB83DRAFT_2380296, partial [Lactarius deliciosus]
ACRAPTPLEFKRLISTNTVPTGIFKRSRTAMGTATASVTTRVSPEVPRNSGPAALCEASSPPREIFEHASRPSLDDLHVLTRGKHITDPGRCLVPAPLQEPPLPVRDLRASLLV